MAIRRATHYPGAMSEEIAFARRRAVVRRASLRLNGAFVVAVALSLLLFVPPVLVGWRVGELGSGISGFAMAIAAGGVVSVLVTLLAARAYMVFSSGDRLFADATLTGWVRRGRAERKVSIAREVFDDPNVASIPLHVDRLIGFAGALEARDARTHRHSVRVALHAASVGKQLGLNAEELTRLKAAAKLHDVGALRTPVWAEPTAEEELAVALASAELVGFTGDRRLVSALKHQHENFDGSGLPDGLSGDAIPLTARIIAVADAYESVAREHGQVQAIAGLTEGAGSKFDPEVVEALVADAQASPASALRGAVAGMIPRASQGAAELLRGSASVAAAASIATTAVVATGVAGPPPTRDTESASAGNGVATVAATTVAGRGSSDSNSVTDRVRHVADQKGDDAKSPKVDVNDSDGSVKSHGGQPSGSNQASESSKSDSEPETKTDPPAAQPVEDVVGTVDETVKNTTETVDQVVTDVVETVDQTVKSTTGTVDNVVGGLTGKQK